jgi:hypothetical protein
MSQCRNLLILSAVQTYFLPTLKNSMHISYYHRIGQDESNLTTLTRDTGKRLIEFRLATQKEVYELRQKDASLGALWPFTGEDIDQMIPPEGFPARDLLRRARNRFDELKQEMKLTPKLPAPEALSQYWNELFEKQLQKPHVRLDEGVYEDGLLKILQSKSPRGYKVQRGMERDVQILLEGPEEKIGVSVSNSENMTSLAKQLGRLQEIFSQSRVNGLVFLRDARLPISTTAKVTQQRLHELNQKGMHIIRPQAEAYAALNVLRELWNRAAENDLTIGDSNVSMGELQKWLLERTPRPLQDLIDACEEAAISHPKDLADQLLEFLKGLWIMPLKDVAQKMALAETALAEFVVENLEVAGLLTGPPEVIFLNPEAVSRT